MSKQATTKKTVACLLALECALRAFRPRAYTGNGKREAAGSSLLLSAEHHGGIPKGGGSGGA